MRTATVSILIGLSQPLAACEQPDDTEKQATACANILDDAALDRTVQACTKLIESGGLSHKQLSAAYLNRAIAFQYGTERDFTRAIADYTEAIRLDAGNVAAYQGRGLAHWIGPRANLAKATVDFDAVIRLQPDNFEALGSRCALLALQRARPDQAMEDCNAALKHGNQPELFEMRALLHFWRQEYPSALADYDAAVRANPRSAEALYGRGVVRFRLGHDSEGQRDFVTALRLDPAVAQRATEQGLVP